MNGATSKVLGQVRDITASLLFYIKYLRLMMLCALLVFSGSLVYYAYAKAVYHSRLLLRYNPVNVAIVGNDSALSLARALESRYLIEQASMRLGLTQSLGSYEWIRYAIVKRVSVGMVDSTTLALEVFPYSTDILTSFPMAMLDVYFDQRRQLAEQRRTKQLEANEKQLELLMKKVNERQMRAFDFEQDNAITELFIKQQGLTQVPRDMIVIRQKLDLMDRVRVKLYDPSLDAVSKLALLEQFKKDEMEVGSVIPGGGGTTMPGTEKPQGGGKGRTLQGPSTLEEITGMAGVNSGQESGGVVVVPALVEELKSWQLVERQLRQVDDQIREAQKIYLPGHQKMRALLAKQESLKDSLQIELDGAMKRFELSYAGLKGTAAELEGRLPNYREVTQEFQKFKQAYNLQVGSELSYGDAYADIAQSIAKQGFKEEAMDLLGPDNDELEILGFTILRYDPVSPPKGKLVMIALFLAVGLAAAVPFGLEKLNDQAQTLESLESMLQLPGLGVIPAYSEQQLEDLQRGPEWDQDKPDVLMENFRNLRGSIAMNRDVTIPTQAIMVSSARPREGKTTVSLNLAWAFASMGDRTLLIDCDLRRGRLHRAMRSEASPGMTEVLTQGQSWMGAVQKTPQQNLDFLPRGGIIQGATERLCQPDFVDLINEMRGHYKRIILDTPPVLGLSETTTIQRAVDGLLIVILAESTAKRDVGQAIDQLKKAGTRFFGFVLNRLDLSKIQNHYYYSYYSPYYYTSLEADAEKV